MEIELTGKIIVLLSAILFFGYFEQQVTGFGATVFCLPFALLLIPREIFTPVGWFFTLAQSVYILIRQRNKINIRMLLISLLLAGTLGTIIGYTIVASFPSKPLKIGLAVFIIAHSSLSIFHSRQKNVIQRKLRLWHYIFPVGSGAMQASYGIGGPLLVAFLSKSIFDKDELRSTLAGYWIFLNGFLLTQSMLTTGIPCTALKLWAILTPAVVLGMITGNIALKKINSEHFGLLINIVLIFSSLLMVI